MGTTSKSKTMPEVIVKASPERKQQVPKHLKMIEKEEQRKATDKFFEQQVAKVGNFYKCTRCGTIKINPDKMFCKVSNNPLFNGNDGRSSICYNCANELLSYYTDFFKSRKLAAQLVCLIVGVPYNDSMFDTYEKKMIQDGTNTLYSFARYLSNCQSVYGKGSSEETSIIDQYVQMLKLKSAHINTQIDNAPIVPQTKWSQADKRNMNMCIKEVGYDCFDDPIYSDQDRKDMFTSLAQYLNNGDIAEDKHRRDAAINIVKTNMQIELLDRELTKETKTLAPNWGKIEKLINAKGKLNTVVSTTAKENGISAASAGKKSGSSLAVTSIMKELVDNGVLEAKTNLTSVKMTDAFQKIADISAKALAGQMNITGDEYAEMVARQADTIRSLNKKLDQLEEKIRLLTIQKHNDESDTKRFNAYSVDYDSNGMAFVEPFNE